MAESDEMRLIDANALREDWLQNGENEYVYDTNSFLSSLDDAPTIDPETIPVVRQLREELARVKKERDAAVEQLSELECCEFCKHTECIPRGGVGKCEWEWRGPQKDG